MPSRSPKRSNAANKREPTLAPELVKVRLESVYGPIEWRPRMIAIDELIFTVLTQNTSDLNAERAYDTLRKSLPTWGQVIEAETERVAELIKHGGLSNQKSVRIQKILVEILKRIGHFDLEFLAAKPLEETREWFTSLPGVGP